MLGRQFASRAQLVFEMAQAGGMEIAVADDAHLTQGIAGAANRRVGQELALVLSGRWPMSCVNPTVLPASGLRRWQPVSMERGPNS